MGRTQHSARKFSSALRALLAKTFAAILITLFGGSVAISVNATDDEKPLRVYFIDVEGGQATLFVTPDGQSLLIDTGWPGNDGRDADRIVAAAKRAGLSRINYVLITHYHSDHVGGLAQLVARIPVLHRSRRQSRNRRSFHLAELEGLSGIARHQQIQADYRETGGHPAHFANACNCRQF